MKKNTRSITLLVLLALGASLAYAQQQTQTQVKQNQSSGDSSQYSGVSNPPDTIIMANESMAEPTQQQVQQSQQPIFHDPKPSPSIPATGSSAVGQSSYMNPTPGYHPQASPSYNAGQSDAGQNSAEQEPYNSKWNNTDYGVMTQITPTPASAPPIPCCTQLLTRQNSGYGIANTVAEPTNELNPGTNIPVELLQPISSDNTRLGTSFRAVITANIDRDGEVIIPAGSQMVGVVTNVHPGHRLVERAALRLTPQYILMPDGTSYQLDAQVVHSAAPFTKTNEEGVIRTSVHWAKNSVEYGVGAGSGALAGAALAGPEGALIGTLVGAGAITAHLLINRPTAVVLPIHTLLVFNLMQPMALNVKRN